MHLNYDFCHILGLIQTKISIKLVGGITIIIFILNDMIKYMNQ